MDNLLRILDRYPDTIHLIWKGSFNRLKGQKEVSEPSSRSNEIWPHASILRVLNRRILQGGRDYAILLTLLTTGLRKAEICNLKVGDLNIYRNQAVIDVIVKVTGVIFELRIFPSIHICEDWDLTLRTVPN